MKLRQTTYERIANWLFVLATPGIVFYFCAVIYSIYVLRTAPTAPDASHVIEEVSHGDRRFLTPLQARICLPPLPFIVFGSSFLLMIVATFLGNGCKFNPGIFSRKRR